MNKISICWILLVTGTQLLFGNLVGNPVFIRKNFHAWQIFLLSSSMKLGPGVCVCPSVSSSPVSDTCFFEQNKFLLTFFHPHLLRPSDGT